MTKTSLHPGARWVFRINGILRLIGILFFLSIFVMVYIVRLFTNFPSAGETILSVFELKNGDGVRPVVIIALGSDNRAQDAQTLIDYVRFSY